MSSLVNQTHVGCFVATAVLGKSGKQFQREVERFLSQNGPEWTVNRFKVLWNAANHLRNGDKESAFQLYRENSIAYRKDGFPKGPVRPAVVGYVHSQRPSKVKSFAAVLRIYSSIKLDALSEKQLAKAKKAITTPSGASVSPRRAALSALEGGPRVLSDLREKVRSGELSGSWEPPVRSRYANALRSTSYYYSRQPLPSGWSPRNTPYASMAMSFMTEPWIPESLDSITPIQEMREVIRSQGFGDSQAFAGKISALQEQGAKARVVAMPSAHLQLAFMPLHKRLNDLIRHAFPQESCMDNQRKGILGVLAHLRKGRDVYSVDLSSATDRFPREFSTTVLRELGMGNYADALEEVSTSQWNSPWGPTSYEVGQPMGLYGSFPLFHLSNALVADKCVREVKRDLQNQAEKEGKGWPDRPVEYFPDGQNFFVLGDDIVFPDERVSLRYRKVMQRLGVDISEHKSFSGKVAEFAGFMAVPTTHGVVGFRPYKPPVGSVVTNPVNLLDSVGPALARVSPKWRARFKDYQDTAVERSIDLSPIFPEEVVGQDNPFRGDASTFVNLSNVIAMLSPRDSLPDLSGSTKINRIPLFAERGVGDYYGFNPEELANLDKDRKVPSVSQTPRRLYQDPLMKKARDQQAGRRAALLNTEEDDTARSQESEPTLG